MSVFSEAAKGLLSSEPPTLFTAAEADEELANWEPVDDPYVLTIGAGSDAYIGLHGTLDDIDAVLAHAQEEVRRARARESAGRLEPALGPSGPCPA
ncbi:MULTISPECIES: hypothetical protein [Actinomycetes]|uniref:hypothetical protein n=1 Tax=Actinomycetes TaxID=1760 RepID=UPI00131A247E|nr:MULTISPECIES: hypothetical protein [Actinomycetes]